MTSLPKFNKILIMGGDKNDYVDSDPHNFETYESFNGEEVGTMVYELDLNIIDHFLAASAPVNASTIIPPVASTKNSQNPRNLLLLLEMISKVTTVMQEAFLVVLRILQPHKPQLVARHRQKEHKVVAIILLKLTCLQLLFLKSTMIHHTIQLR